MKTIRVAVVEDHEWLRERVMLKISQAAGFVCVGGYRTAEDALAALPAQAADVVVLDINLPGLSGIECLSRLKPQCPQTQFLMLTAYEESEKIFQSLLAGASGYLLKRSDTAELLEAIRQVQEGGSPMSSAIARQVVQYFNRMGAGPTGVEQLTPREREVLELLARGAAYKQIAADLDLSIDTIRMNVRHIYAKLHVHSRGEAVAKYLQRP